MTLYNIIGSLGAGMIIIVYLLLQLEKIKATHLMFPIVNAIGAALLLVSLMYDFNLPAFIIEVFWLLISFVGIFRVAGHRTTV